MERLTILRAKTKELFDNSGLQFHNWSHIWRDYRRGEYIAEREGGNKVIILSALLLHDVGYCYTRLENHGKSSAAKCGEILEPLGFSTAEIEAIRHCILAHDPPTGAVPETIEAKIVFDADMLEKIDPEFLFANGIYNIAAEFAITLPGYAELYVKRFGELVDQGRAFYTATGRELDGGRLALTIDYFRRFYNLG